MSSECFLDENLFKMTSSEKSTKNKKEKKFFRKKLKKSKTDEAEEKLGILLKQLENFDPAATNKFQDYPLSEETKQGLKFASYEQPTPIQRMSIHRALVGRDILGAAKTGSGKTLAFLIPVLEKLYKLKWGHLDGLGALIMSPTRELATQIFHVLRKVGKFHRFRTTLIIGGSGAKSVINEQDMIRTSNIVVCTPGRILDHIEHAAQFNVDDLQILVLDEADRLLDAGFAEAVNSIVRSLPTERQTLLFSATQTKSVKDLARLSLKSPVYVSPDENDAKSTPATLTEVFTVCELEKKLDFLWSFLRNHLKMKVLVFFSTCKQVRYVYEVFRHLRPGIPLLRLHRARKQHQRLETYNQFCRKQFAVLFATNLAARGLDFSSVHWVVQMDCPADAVTYIHRVGRTARNEKKGNSLLVLLPSEEDAMIGELEKKKVQIQRVRMNPTKSEFSIRSKIQGLCVRDPELKEFARMAFLSYVKDVFKMSNKKIFDASKLPLQAFAQSLGLHIVPKLRFIKRTEKLHNASKDIEGDSVGDSDGQSEDHLARQSKTGDERLGPQIEDDSSDEDEDNLFTVTKTELPLDLDESEPAVPIGARKLKAITKVQEVKQLLKHVRPTSVLFDDSGNPVDESTVAESYVAKLDDEMDLKNYKNRLAKERELKKQKLKDRKRNSKEKRRQDFAGVQLKIDDDEDDSEAGDKEEVHNNKNKEKPKKQKAFKTEARKRSRDERAQLDEGYSEIRNEKKMMKLDNGADEEESLSWLI